MQQLDRLIRLQIAKFNRVTDTMRDVGYFTGYLYAGGFTLNCAISSVTVFNIKNESVKIERRRCGPSAAIICSRLLIAIIRIRPTYSLCNHNHNPNANLWFFLLKLCTLLRTTAGFQRLFVFELGDRVYGTDRQTDGQTYKTRNAAYWDGTAAYEDTQRRLWITETAVFLSRHSAKMLITTDHIFILSAVVTGHSTVSSVRCDNTVCCRHGTRLYLQELSCSCQGSCAASATTFRHWRWPLHPRVATDGWNRWMSCYYCR